MSKLDKAECEKKMKTEGALPVELLEIDKTLPSGSGYYKQLAEQLELQGKLEVAISPEP